jgi:hypothetical protein
LVQYAVENPPYRIRRTIGFWTTDFIQFPDDWSLTVIPIVSSYIFKVLTRFTVYRPTKYAGTEVRCEHSTCTWDMLGILWFVSSALSMFVLDRISRPKPIAGGVINRVCNLITECLLVMRYFIGTGENKAALCATVAMLFRVPSLHSIPFSHFSH